MKFKMLFCLLALTVAPVWSQSLRLHLAPDKTECRIGNRLHFQLEVENPTPESVTFRYFQPAFFYPTFHCAAGKVNQVNPEVYNGPCQMVTVTILPGERKPLPAASFSAVDKCHKGPDATWMTKPGIYQLEYRLTLEGPAGKKWDLRSNSVELKVSQET